MPWWLADRGQTLDRESVRVRLPSSLTRRLGDAMRASQKSKRKKAKTNRTLRTWVLDTVDGRAQPDQYGGHHCRLGRGAARPSRCQAFLRLAAFAQSRGLRVRSGRCGDGGKGARSDAARGIRRSGQICVIAVFTGRRFFIQFVDRRQCGVRGVVAAMETVAWSSGCR